MYVGEFLIFFGLFYSVICGILNIKREIKQVSTNYISDIMQSEVKTQLTRSLTECAQLCWQSETCSSIFYKDSDCWLIQTMACFSTNSCFQAKNENSTAYVGVSENSWAVSQPSTTTCNILIEQTSSCDGSTITHCASQGMQYNTCEIEGASHITSIVVDRQISSSPCNFCTSFGVTDNVIWVDNGCRADFAICYSTIT